MRTTLAIDDDVLAAARHLAEREHKSVGEIITSLARQGLLRGQHPSEFVRNGIVLLPKQPNAAPVTLEIVNQLRDEAP